MTEMKTWDRTYLNIAKEISQQSFAQRRKVGCILVKEGSIIAFGYNGMPSGWDNNCEIGDKTRPEVLHAETNALTKLTRSTMSSSGSTMYVTLSPCIDCAKLIVQSDISRVVFDEQYRDTSGIEFLIKSNIKVEQIEQ